MKRSKLLLPVAIVVTLAAVLWASLSFAGGAGARQAAAGGALPAERAAAYREALLRAYEQRQEAYLVQPALDVAYDVVLRALPPGATAAEIEAALSEYYRDFHFMNNKVSRPNPMARLGRMKQIEAAQLRGEEPAPLSGEPHLLTVMMNFDGQQTFQGGANGDPVALNGTCLTDTSVYTDGFTFTVDGPSFNEIEQPDDNWTPWIPADSYTGGFSKTFFEKFMYSTEGYTDVWRPDLENPWDGGMGFDFSGSTFKNYFLENSRGVYDPGGVVEEITVPVAVSYFGAGACTGAVQDDSYWGRPRSTIAISAAQQLNIQYPGADTASNPDFNWSDFDIEDVFDYDNDGNLQEPDGYVDHFFLIEAGEAQSGKYAEHLVWPHSSDINPGAPGVGPAGNTLGGMRVATDASHPLGEVWVLNYTVSDEVGGLGVLVHEYGHDIGLPDNYAYDGSGPNPGFWDQMNAGTFGGALSGMHPTHMTIWDKYEPYLAWNDPVELNITQLQRGEGNTYQIGQQSIPPEGTVDGLKITLPDLVSIAPITPSDEFMWWSDMGDDRNESIANSFTPQADETITVSAQMAYFIETDWDYMYWEVSGTLTDDWVPLEVYSGTTLLSTDTNPNGANIGNGVTGSSGGWITAHMVISDSWVDGSEMQFRFRYYTDAAVQENGIYLDNISVVGSESGALFTDDAESGDIWTHMSEGINTSDPWFITDGVITAEHHYLVEWRNSGEGTGFDHPNTTQEAFEIAGFDIGLNRMYWVDDVDDTPNANILHVDRFFNHTPGMVIWYANDTYGGQEIIGTRLDHPSYGAHARVLAVDANPYPYYVEDADLGLRAVGERRSSFDAAFTLNDRPPMPLSSNYPPDLGNDVETVIPGDWAEPAFHDRLNYVPGISAGFFIDYDAGAVIPSRDDVPYWAAWDTYGDAGNPGVNGYGVNLEVLDQGEDGTWGEVRFWLDDDTVFLRQRASASEVDVGEPVNYTITLKDAAGSRYADSLPYNFDATLEDLLPEGATLVEGSLSVTNHVFDFYDPEEGHFFGPGTVSSDADSVNWEGTIGGNPTTLEDAIIQYAVTYDAPGCYDTAVTLTVQQEMLEDTFRNNGEPFLWPRNSEYTTSTRVCVGGVTAVSVDALSAGGRADVLPFAVAGAFATLLAGGLYLHRRRTRGA